MPAKPISEVVQLLDAGQAERGWRIFLENYNSLILHIVHQYQEDQEQVADCFLFICEKLCESDYARLRAFDLNRGVPFRTWLGVVVSRLCIDWQRHLHGRKRPASAVSRLPQFEQLLYHLRYEDGLDLESCRRAVEYAYPDVSREALSEANSEIHRALSSRQRWRLSYKNRRMVPLLSGQSDDYIGGRAELTTSEPGPDSVAEMLESAEAVREALAYLDVDQRLLLRLRYKEDLPLKEIARLTGLKDASQARHRINAALMALGALLTSIQPAA